MLPSVLPTEADHIPVLAEEVLRALAPWPGDTVVDCTFGPGGTPNCCSVACGATAS